MKRFTLALILMPLLALTVVAAQKTLPSAVRSTLEDAVTNERNAAARYEAFAVKADAEGYAGAAALFRAQARAEKIHAQRFAQALKNAGAAVPDAAPAKFETGSTEDNLRAAASAEMSERDGFYRDAVAACRDARDESTAKLFDQTRDSEVEHANLDAAASRNLGQMKNAKSYYVCDRCGYTTDVRLPLCPSCRHSGALERID